MFHYFYIFKIGWAATLVSTQLHYILAAIMAFATLVLNLMVRSQKKKKKIEYEITVAC